MAEEHKRECLNSIQENQILHLSFRAAFECVAAMKEENIDKTKEYFNILETNYIRLKLSPEYKHKLFDFLTYIGFVELSFKMYKTCLKIAGLDLFDDTVIEELSKMSNSTFLRQIRRCWWNFSDQSQIFSARCASTGILEETVKDLESMVGSIASALVKSYTFKSCTGILHNLAKVTSLRQTFRDLKVVDMLGNFLLYTDHPIITVRVLLILSRIIDEEQYHLLQNSSSDSVFGLSVNMANKSWENPDHRCLLGDSTFWAQELIEGLAGFARNDKVKVTLVEKGILSLLPSVLRTGNEGELDAAANLLWELSFDEGNQRVMEKNHDLVDAINEVLKRRRQREENNTPAKASKDTVKALKGTLWNLKRTKPVIPAAAASSSTQEEPGGVGGGRTSHIMISYNREHRSLVKQVRESLREAGLAVWVDYENMSGSTLEAMAGAVEASSLVLMCLSDHYKESPNCRMEAEYALTSGKHIVPLMMQRGYRPDGWLGLICGAKYFYDFSGKYPYADKMGQLLEAIDEHLRPEKAATTVPFTDAPDRATRPADSQVMKASTSASVSSTPPRASATAAAVAATAPASRQSTAADIRELLTQRQLSGVEAVGQLTRQQALLLKRMSRDAPEFYFSFISSLATGKVSAEQLGRLTAIDDVLDNIS